MGMSKNISNFLNSINDKRIARALQKVMDQTQPIGLDTAITAYATGGQTNAKVLRQDCAYHDVTVVATAADSVALPYPFVGEVHFVKNSAALAMQVFAPSPGTIDSVATGTGVSQLAGDGVLYVCVVKDNYIRLGGVSATEVFGAITATSVTIPDGGLYLGAGVGTSVTATAAELNYTDITTLGVSQASKVLTTDAAESLLWTTTDATASETVTLDVEDTRTGAGATGWAIKGGLNTNVALGSYANGVYGILNFTGSGGKVTGLGAGIASEIVMSSGCTAGTYAALELELGMPTGAVSANSGTSFIYAQVYGADIATFDTSGYLLNLQGVTAGTSKMFMNVGTTTALADFVTGLRIKIGTTDYVIPLITAAEFAS